MLPEKPENSKSLDVFHSAVLVERAFRLIPNGVFLLLKNFNLFPLNAAVKLFIISQQCSGWRGASEEFSLCKLRERRRWKITKNESFSLLCNFQPVLPALL